MHVPVGRVECHDSVLAHEDFDYTANLENFGDWFPGVIGIVASNELPFGAPGKQYSETVAVPLRGKRTVVIRVVEASAPQRIVTEGDLPVLLPRMEIEFRDVGADSCEVRWRMSSRNENVLVRFGVLPLARLADAQARHDGSPSTEVATRTARRQCC